jgi:hypothetical protein
MLALQMLVRVRCCADGRVLLPPRTRCRCPKLLLTEGAILRYNVQQTVIQAQNARSKDGREHGVLVRKAACSMNQVDHQGV